MPAESSPTLGDRGGSDDRASTAPATEDGRARSILLLLAACVALLMTGFGIVLPVFGRRLPELGGGVDALGILTMAFAVGQTLFAPVAGSLGDRFGRRPIVVAALGGIVLANVAFLLARDVPVYIAIRLVEGAITAGLLPAAMAAVGDLVPEHRRARWTGIIMGSYGAGFIFGPALGGLLYDTSGFAAPFLMSAALGLTGLIWALIKLPETRPDRALAAATTGRRRGWQGRFWASLPRPLAVLAALLFLDFIGTFAFAFIEPELIFYFYQDLGYSTTHFGVIIGAYGIAMVAGQASLGGVSDRLSRRLAIAIGFLLLIPFYAALIVTGAFPILFAAALLAGLGVALVLPALSALYLDITAEDHRSRILGLKESAAAFGGVTGPLLVALVSRWTTPRGVFAIATALTVLSIAVALGALPRSRRGRRGGPDPDGRSGSDGPISPEKLVLSNSDL